MPDQVLVEMLARITESQEDIKHIDRHLSNILDREYRNADVIALIFPAMKKIALLRAYFDVNEMTARCFVEDENDIPS